MIMDGYKRYNFFIISPHMAFYSNILYIFAEISISLGKRFRCQYLYYACGISINPA
ncbi:hypothetical protein IMSAG192_00411 [Muribaculaceae bacterium]|nr:hypothetical protein IMSAG192_00411 [Muribaculaceae bacterium]